MMRNNPAIWTVVLLLIVGGVFYYANSKFQKNTDIKPKDEVPVSDDIQTDNSEKVNEIVVEGSNFKFNPTEIKVKKGEKTRIVFKNIEGNHDFRVDELNIATEILQGAGEDSVEFTADKTGSFEFYCSVGEHRQMGMVGTLTVE